MPALPAAPGVIRTTLDFTVGPDTAALCRFFIHYGGTAPTGANLTTLAGVIDAAWGAQFNGLVTSDSALLAVELEDLSSSTGALGENDTEQFGSNGGAPLPAASAFIIGFSIARRYRGGKPKIFLPIGVSSSIGSNMKWTAAFIASAASAWNNFIAASVASPWTGGGPLTHVNVSYYSGFTVVTNPITHRARNVPTLRGAPVVDAVTGYTTEFNMGAQRRRNRQ
jgi:hypothetical protein